MRARLLFAALLLAVGCGPDAAAPPAVPEPTPPDPAPTDPGGSLDLPDDPAALFLEVWRFPGFVPIEYSLGRPPRYALNVGGGLFSEGPIWEIFPGPLLPDIRLAQISDEALDAVIEAIEATDLPTAVEVNIPQPVGGPFLADAPAIELVLTDRGGPHRIRIERFGAVSHTDPRVAPITELVSLLDRTAAAADSGRYEGDRVQVHASAGPRPPDPSVLNERPWPLPDPPPPEGDAGFSCAVYAGEVAAGLLGTFATANHGTRWNFEGGLHQILARSLLPGEEGCLR